MSAGVRLLRRLVLEAAERVADGSGGYGEDWVPLGVVWADVQPKGGREDFVAGRPQPRVKYRILVRAAPAGAPSRPRPQQRLRDGARVFRILTVTESDPGGRYLEIVAEEGLLP
ncbi:head-tail adaptor protein [Amaricoccus sp.]|uniref:head-tail adaptor protein n=1 Tax=Amaricoccus sp. TaxID=1872485 RepID=UPI0026031E2F|nr:head-tail adaptor protein [Amaricoccus sp.]HRO11729.1 head-tail adaptor protein [Amaricoccus sp.]